VRAWWLRSGSKYSNQIALGVTLIACLAVLFLAYGRERAVVLDVGAPGDGPFLTGFYADEPDIDFRYRWTKSESTVEFTGAGSAAPSEVVIQAQGPHLADAGQPIAVAVTLNGVSMVPAVVTLTDTLQSYSFGVQGDTGLSPPYVLGITSTTFRPAGDNRSLGFKLDAVSLLQGDGANLPPLFVVLWLIVFVLGLAGVLKALHSLWRNAGLVVLGLVVTAGVFWGHVLYPAVYFPFAAALVGALGVLVWQRQLVARAWRSLGALRSRLLSFRSVDGEGSRGRFRPDWAWAVMLGATLAFAGVALWAIPQVAWIGHADYAENANIARSLVEGHGLSVDYTAQFYTDRPQLTHAADTWPLLQPLLIAPFFAVFGPQTWAAKLPNLLILLALAWAVFYVGARLWDRRAGLIAGLLTLLHPYFFNTVLFPINDLAFTALFFALGYVAWRAVEGQERGRGLLIALLIGALAGLLIWSKPSGAALLVGLGLGAGWMWWRRRGRSDEEDSAPGEREIPWRGLLVAGGAFALVVVPLIIRNTLDFGSPFYSTEGYDAWILRYWPFYEWENIYKYYVGSELPHPRWLVGGKFGYQNLFDAIGINFSWVWIQGVMSDVSKSDFVIGIVPLLGAGIGLVTASRRAVRLFGLAFFSMGLYALFILLYWHYEGRYFQVLIPWCYLLLAGGMVWLADVVGALWRGRTGKVAAAIALVVLAGAFMWPSFEPIRNDLTNTTRPTSFTVAMDWLVQNSTPSDVVMTRDPWELNWHSRRRAVMIPLDDLATIKEVARRYGATMLQLGGPTDGINVANCPADANAKGGFPTGTRPALGKLYCGYEIPGFTLVYKNGDLTIYRLSQ
jgi:4-amino-4-deoxy-L-arabinose transferase-like glycosyltransferase